MLYEALLNNARQKPDDIAVIDDAGSHTYRQVAAIALGLSRHLSNITQRQTVGIMLPSSAGFVGSFFATLLAGKVVVPINFLLSEREIAHVINDSGIDTVIAAGPLATKLAGFGLNVIDLPELKDQVESLAREGIAAFKPPEKNADEMAVLIYTSGTSGLPKGVVLTFNNIQSDVDAAIQHAELKHKHKFLGMVPLFHAFGMTALMIAPIQLGATAVYMSRFNPTAAVKAIAEHQISIVFAVPSMYGAMLHLKNADASHFKSIYCLISGAEPCPSKLREAFAERFGVSLFEGYGLTETSPVVALNTPNINRAGSVGKMVPGARARIVGDDLRDVAAGEQGEIWLSGPMIMKEYFHLPDATAAALTEDGFFKTGDLGKFDPDGFLYITGRKKDLIIVAGEKVVPRDVEDALLQHAGVAEAAVVGRKDPARGEVVVAFVTAKPDQTLKLDELRDACRTHGLSQWQIPREIFIETDLPRSPTGKVLKRVLSERVNAPA